jgi:hypothetical protein
MAKKPLAQLYDEGFRLVERSQKCEAEKKFDAAHEALTKACNVFMDVRAQDSASLLLQPRRLTRMRADPQALDIEARDKERAILKEKLLSWKDKLKGCTVPCDLARRPLIFSSVPAPCRTQRSRSRRAHHRRPQRARAPASARRDRASVTDEARRGADLRRQGVLLRPQGRGPRRPPGTRRSWTRTRFPRTW